MTLTIPPIHTIFDPMPDWRKAKGKRYKLSSLLNFIILAMLCGKVSTRSMARWGKYLPEGKLKRIGLAGNRRPSTATLCRVFWQIKPELLERQIREWVAQTHQTLVEAGVSKGIAIDGKSIRRAASLGSPNAYLVAAVCHQLRFVLNQQAVPEKTNEITCVPSLLEQLLLKGLVVTVDALLTQRPIAQQIRQADGHYLMIVKGNQPNLWEAIDTLFNPPDRLPPCWQAKQVNKGHGRVEVREISTSTELNDYLDWPDVAQVFHLQRTRHISKTGLTTTTSVYGVTSLSPVQASPAELIAITRDHWAAIENGLHWVRDVVLREDDSTTRKPGAPQVRAIFRNILINLARLTGFESVSEALDAWSANPLSAFSLLGL